MTWARRVFDPLILGQWRELFLFYSTQSELILSFLGVGVHVCVIPHFVPTSSSWLNLVERWFGELTSKRVRRGSFCSVKDLQNAITEFMAAWNDNPSLLSGRLRWN
jgi:hypothetical protein